MNKEIIKLNNVTIGYGKEVVVSGINLTVYENDFIGIVGPNGAGKTTLLKTLLGNLKLLGGTIYKDSLRFGYVPQRDTVQPLLPYSVFDVVMMGRYSLSGIFKRITETDRKIVEESLSYVGLSDLKHKNYNSLSGGQRQRTLIARALAVQPNVLILDEPTNGMDLSSRIGILDLIKHFHKEHNITVIMVSHLLNDVANYVHRIALVEENYFQVDTVKMILTDKNLSSLYGLDIKVGECFGITFIAAGGKSV